MSGKTEEATSIGVGHVVQGLFCCRQCQLVVLDCDVVIHFGVGLVKEGLMQSGYRKNAVHQMRVSDGFLGNVGLPSFVETGEIVGHGEAGVRGIQIHEA